MSRVTQSRSDCGTQTWRNSRVAHGAKEKAKAACSGIAQAITELKSGETVELITFITYRTNRKNGGKIWQIWLPYIYTERNTKYQQA